jgi:thiamine pyrophosphate-dependent acetolactate synthase large subunit-like protein
VTTTAEALVQRLEDHGVTHAFGIPGTHSLPVYGALAGSSIEHVVCRHEQGVGFAADGFARSSGRPGVAITTTGPALLNAAAAVAAAWADSVPMLLISPGLPDNVDGRDTGQLHELRTQSGVMRALLGASYRATGPADAAELVDAAFASFATSRPRPFHIELPLDVMDASGPAPAPWNCGRTYRPTPDADGVAAAAALIAAANAPVMVLGGGAVGAGPPALRLARRFDMPVVTSINGKAIIPEDDPLSLGASLRLPACHALLGDADVVIAVGTELADSDTWSDGPLELGGDVIRIDIDPAQLQRNALVSVGLVADATAGLEALLSDLEGTDRAAAPPASVGLVADATAGLEALLADLEGTNRATAPLAHVREEIHRQVLELGSEFVALVAVLQEHLDPATIVAADSAMACYYGAVHLLRQQAPRRFLHPTGSGTLGFALPAGIGAKLANPDVAVLVITGDGGALFSLSELATAAELGLPLVVLVIDNGGYGEIKRQMLTQGLAPLGTDLVSPDFAAIARAFGCEGHLIAELADLPERLREAFAAAGPTVLEIKHARIGS